MGRKEQTANAGKLPVGEPLSLKGFIIIFVMHMCRKILLGLDTKSKLALYLAIITVISFLTDLAPAPRTYFADKKNFINHYFVKWCWGWTLLVLGGFIYTTSNVYCCGNSNRVRKHMMRLVIGTCWWYTCTSVFEYIENKTGVCLSQEDEFLNKKSCVRAGYGWSGIDISGHTFMMVFCLLSISEEAQVISGWEKIRDTIKKEEQVRTQRMSSNEFSTLKVLFNDPVPYRVSVIALACLDLIWNLMLFTTVIYFHDMPTKLAGALTATFAWFVSYRMFYQIDEISPGMPGEGPFKFLK